MVIDSDALVEFSDDLECVALLSATFDLQSRVNAKLKILREGKLEQLKEHHAAAVVSRREHGETLARLRVRRAELQAEVSQIEKALGDASFKLRLLRDQPPRAEDSLPKEIEQHNAKVAAAEKDLERVRARQADMIAAMSSFEREASEANATLGRLDKEVQSLFDEIRFLETGQRPRRHDPSTGLWA